MTHADRHTQDEATALLADLAHHKDLSGKDWTIRQARKLGMSEDDIKKMLSAS